MVKKTHADKRLARFVTRRIAWLQGTRTQAEIAAEAGHVNPDNLTIIKTGALRLALARVPDLARTLDFDPALLLRLAMELALGATAARAVGEIWGTRLTHNERESVAGIRDASGDSDPRLTTRSRATLREIFGR